MLSIRVINSYDQIWYKPHKRLSFEHTIHICWNKHLNIQKYYCQLLTAAIHLFVFGKGFFLLLFHQFSQLWEYIPQNMGNSYHNLIFFPTSESISIVFSISWWETVISFRFRFFPVTLVWFKHPKIFCWLACCCPL